MIAIVCTTDPSAFEMMLLLNAVTLIASVILEKAVVSFFSLNPFEK